ncbi:PREDICTED: uncharacterized protein LOC108378550 [Rhagoletis zephyria]|uniref:uncharacterized protein LOC108378550 n=1 Tax=Rhagoletis zephyria TaxID=28612 RepID=UPI0008119EED|nr:PREDICTED: uncharacterized protein LOC108378550 [Rhagoletis zephyria]
MNNKYHLSEEKSIDRKPECNEEAILNLFKEKIPINAASIIISRDIKTLFEAYRILEQNNWTRSDRKYQFTKFNSSDVNKSDKNKYTSAPRNYQNYQRYQNVNQNQQNQVNQPSDLNINYNQWQNKQPTVNARQQNVNMQQNYQPTQFTRGNTRQTKRQVAEPMEIDNVLVENFAEEAQKKESPNNRSEHWRNTSETFSGLRRRGIYY